MERLFATARRGFGSVDILVSNAAYCDFTPVDQVDEAETDTEEPRAAETLVVYSGGDGGFRGPSAPGGEDPGVRPRWLNGVVRLLCALGECVVTRPSRMALIYAPGRAGAEARSTMASHSVRRRTAASRSAYTGESTPEAQAGIPRDQHRHGLDACTPQQHALRALLAVAVFNSERLGAPPRDWWAHVLNVYTFHLSPRFNDLHIATDAPWNVAWRMSSSRSDSKHRIPGLRALCYRPDHTRFWHLPTEATFLVRYNNDTGERLECARPCPQSRHTQEMLALDHPMGPHEASEWAAVPPMSDSARDLLAALFTRMSLKAPDRSWATSGWHYPPHDVPDAFPYQGEPGRMLWGAGDYWTLRWYGFPNPEFVAEALTDPAIGLDGAAVETADNDLVVYYRTAQLRLVEENRHMLGSTIRVLEAFERAEKRRFPGL